MSVAMSALVCQIPAVKHASQIIEANWSCRLLKVRSIVLMLSLLGFIPSDSAIFAQVRPSTILLQAAVLALTSQSTSSSAWGLPLRLTFPIFPARNATAFLSSASSVLFAFLTNHRRNSRRNTGRLESPYSRHKSLKCLSGSLAEPENVSSGLLRPLVAWATCIGLSSRRRFTLYPRPGASRGFLFLSQDTFTRGLTGQYKYASGS